MRGGVSFQTEVETEEIQGADLVYNQMGSSGHSGKWEGVGWVLGVSQEGGMGSPTACYRWFKRNFSSFSSLRIK